MGRMPAPAPSCADDPSTYTDQMSACLSTSTDWSLYVLSLEAFEKCTRLQSRQVLEPLQISLVKIPDRTH